MKIISSYDLGLKNEIAAWEILSDEALYNFEESLEKEEEKDERVDSEGEREVGI